MPSFCNIYRYCTSWISLLQDPSITFSFFVCCNPVIYNNTYKSPNSPFLKSSLLRWQGPQLRCWSSKRSPVAPHDHLGSLLITALPFTATGERQDQAATKTESIPVRVG